MAPTLDALLLTFDFLPLSLVGCYGVEWVETPNFDRLAALGTTFDFCFATQTLSPGLHGILTDSTVGDDAAQQQVTSNWETQLQSVKAAGASNHIVWKRRVGLPETLLPDSDLVDLYLEDFFSPEELRHHVARWLNSPPDEISKESPEDFDWLVEHLDALAETGKLDREHPPDSIELALFRRALAAVIVGQLDVELGQILDANQAAVADGTRMVIVAGLTGTRLMQHPLVDQGMPPLVDELLHVPLFVWTGHLVDRGIRQRQLIESADIVDILHHWFTPSSPGPSAEAGLPEAAASTDMAQSCSRWRPTPRTSIVWNTCDGSAALRTSEFHYITTAQHEDLVSPQDGKSAPDQFRPLEEGEHWLFQKPGDIWDLRNEHSQFPDTTSALFHQLRQA